jgi:peptidoglycan/LPS O-acetylase OafA/YrhL
MLAVYGNPALDAVRGTARSWITWGLPLGVAGLAISIGFREPHFQETFRYTLQGVALIPLFVIAVRSPDWGPCRLLNLGWVRRIGALSYSIYLLHTTVLFGIHQWTSWPVLLQGVVSLGVSLVLATMIDYAVERPCARLRRRLSRVGGRPRDVRADGPVLTLPAAAPVASGGATLFATTEVLSRPRTLESATDTR